MKDADSIIKKCRGLTIFEGAILKTRLKAAGLDFTAVYKKSEKKTREGKINEKHRYSR